MAKKGYSKIDNVLFDSLDKLEGLTGADFRVLICIIRNTICYRDNTDLSCLGAINYFVNGTGLSEKQVRKSLTKLKKMGIINISPANGKNPQKIYLKVVQIGILSGTNWCFRVVQNEQKNVDLYHQEIKEEIKEKEIKEEERASLTFSSEQEWREWMAQQEDEEDEE